MVKCSSEGHGKRTKLGLKEELSVLVTSRSDYYHLLNVVQIRFWSTTCGL